jgi:hypothetical protein
MTLCNFLRDYVYIPLGGGRTGTLQKYRNLLVTMFLGGLWHGAAWTFVLWGIYHGVLLCVNHIWRSVKISVVGGYARPAAGVGILLTFVAVSFGWVLFRAQNLSSAATIYRGLFSIPVALKEVNVLAPSGLGALLVGGLSIVWLMPNSIRIARYIEGLGARGPTTLREALVGVACAAIFFAGVVTQFGARIKSPFLYFQF